MKRIAKFLKRHNFVGVSSSKCVGLKALGIDYIAVLDANEISCIDDDEYEVQDPDYDAIYDCIVSYFEGGKLYNVVYYNEDDLLTSDILFADKNEEFADALINYGIKGGSIISYQSIPMPNKE